ncbi:type II toxin-antitoxin system RelE/ParE family toxin [Bartonella sp. WD12.1]|uniref:type II toxin-antitoxin system RelE/ParE family toxin n=1 Tax=Bartonella sp. WD12.1 TaxID=1933903 RepID=UPI003204FAEE
MIGYHSKQKGKSGGYRIITFFSGQDIPVFLLDIYSKSSQGNLTKAERNELKKILTALLNEYRREM